MTKICPDWFRNLLAASWPTRGACALRCALALAAGFVVPVGAAPAEAPAVAARPAALWQALLAEPGRRLEIDRMSIKQDDTGKKAEAWGRLILARPLPDAVSGTSFRVLESYIRFDCDGNNFATLRRVFKKDRDEEIRAEEDRIPAERPVRADSFEDRVMRVACRPGGKAGERFDFKNTLKAANRAASRAAEAPVPVRKRLLSADLGLGEPPGQAPSAAGKAGANQGEASRELSANGDAAAANASRPPVAWAYAGDGGPAQWALLRPEYHLCDQGTRQAPIDVRDPVAVDLPPLAFDYQPSLFRLSDRGHSLHLVVGENRLRLLGRDYLLLETVFHHPGEVAVRGEQTPMAVHLHHRADDGRLLIVVVPLQTGTENPAVQIALNHLPLERHLSVEPPDTAIDLGDLLPSELSYATFMGSLSTPPCTEGVQWIVLKQAVTVSAEQLAIFARRYPNNARPLQPAHGRLIKESRAL